MMMERHQERGEAMQSCCDQGRSLALEVWITRTLKRAHDAALAEPLPEDLLRLAERFG
jgi:hypothetical protein